MNDTNKNAKVTIDGKEYAMDNLSNDAKLQITNIQFCEEKIVQLQNEWAISNTAQVGYLSELKMELARLEKAGS